MEERHKVWISRKPTALEFLQVVIACGVVLSSIGNYFLIQDHIKVNTEQIIELQRWKTIHGEEGNNRSSLITALKERVDACCPFYDGRHK